MNSSKLRFLIFISVIAALMILGNFFSIDQERIDSFLQQFPILYSSLIFVVFYIVGTFLLWYLKDPLKIIGAILFGAYISTILIYIAEIVNAFIFFNISNILGRDFVEKSLRGKFKGFYTKLEEMNLGWIFLLRGVPLIPYRVLDLSFGLSKVPFRKYLLVVLLASLPRIFWIQFILAGARSLSPIKISEYFLQHPVIYFWTFAYFLLAIVVTLKLQKGKS